MSELFQPSVAELALYGTYELENPQLFPVPDDVPEGWIAYNPSGIWTNPADGVKFMYVRVEPNRSDASSSHLGKSVIRPYEIVDLDDPSKGLIPYGDGRAHEYVGEDPALTRVFRRLPDDTLEEVW